jgi:hypothetical protein
VTETDPHRSPRTSTSEGENLARMLRSSLLASAIAAVIAFVAFGIFVGDSAMMAQWVLMASIVAGSAAFTGMTIARRISGKN